MLVAICDNLWPVIACPLFLTLPSLVAHMDSCTMQPLTHQLYILCTECTPYESIKSSRDECLDFHVKRCWVVECKETSYICVKNKTSLILSWQENETRYQILLQYLEIYAFSGISFCLKAYWIHVYLKLLIRIIFFQKLFFMIILSCLLNVIPSLVHL